jgi:pilus assembly protein CpaE
MMHGMTERPQDAKMPTYFLSTNLSTEQSAALEKRLKGVIPDLTKITRLEDVARESAGQPKTPVYILVAGPADNDAYLDRFISIAAQYRDRFFFILISDDISTNNYKRLVRTGSADWISAAGAPQEVAEIFAKRRVVPAAPQPTEGDRSAPTTIAFLPCAGGVGNTTLLAEIGVGLKLQKTTKDRRICMVDLDFQTSHICDYLDIEARLQIQEIVENPERLDAQLFDIFVSRHSSGLDVFAAPRSKLDVSALDVAALDALFEMIGKHYELILIDLPVTWFPWTTDIIANSNAVVLTAINTIPCLRQLSQTLAAVREARPTGTLDSISVVINRCDRTLLGGVDRRQHVESVLGEEHVFYVSNDSAAVIESTNTGTPLAASGNSRRISKEISAIAAFCIGVKPANVKAA